KNDESRFFIFATRESLQLLNMSQDWLADGTFETSPSLFCQIYTVHAVTLCKGIVPLVYMLLPNKAQATYVRAFSKLQELLENPLVQRIITDFEYGVINAFG